MGQHKSNPTAIAAKEGKLPPKPPALSKRERDEIAYQALKKALHKRGLPVFEDLLGYSDFVWDNYDLLK